MCRPEGMIGMFGQVVALLLCLGAFATPALAGKRVALVIGNSAYVNAPALPNPTRDAGDIADSFTRLGFTVTTKLDATGTDMRRALVAFGREAQGAEMAAIFYAGHGMEIGGENWLIPIDAEMRSDTDADSEAIALRNALAQVAKASNFGMVILDACRNNPFANNMQRSFATRAVERGLARVEPPTDNILVAYAARDGTTAADGDGRNSPFTAALLRNLETPGLEVRFLFSNVRDDVIKATRRTQQPFVYASLSGTQIFLKDAAAAPAQVVDGLPGAGKSEPAQATAPAVVAAIAPSDRTRRLNVDLTSEPLIDEMIDRLYEQSFDPGDRGSKETRTAIENYEKVAGLTVDGRATEGLLDSLRETKQLRPWGALAFSSDGKAWGMAWASPTRRQASAVAKTRCGSDKCTFQLTFFGQRCGALALSKQNWSMSWRVGGDASRKAALAECGKDRAACRIIGSVCADGSEKTN